MTKESLQAHLDGVKRAVAEAGEAILDIYADPSRFETEHKADDSPLTAADLAANNVLVRHLQAMTPEIPVLSEESAQAPWAERQQWPSCWVVDPLDGTKEFLKRNDEFTVNVALIDGHRPVLGVVYAPALGRWYFAAEGLGAWRQDGDQPPEAIAVVDQDPQRPWRVVGSRSHPSEELQAFVDGLGSAELVSMGSSLKLCLVAEGAADIYPRLGSTSEWDTAAAHAVVKAAGGDVYDAHTGQPLTYNARECILNPHFIVCANPQAAWFEASDH